MGTLRGRLPLTAEQVRRAPETVADLRHIKPCLDAVFADPPPPGGPQAACAKVAQAR